MKKSLIVIGFMAVLLIGCGKTKIAETYEESEDSGIIHTYCEMSDGTYHYRKVQLNYGIYF